MKNEKENEKLVVEVFSSQTNHPIAKYDVDNFDFMHLLKHRDVNSRKFDFVLIAKEIEYFDNTIIKPMIAIYDKNRWKVKTKITKKDKRIMLKNEYKSQMMNIDAYGSVANMSARDQKDIIAKYYTTSKVLNASTKIANQLIKKRTRIN